jgi:hypothetical protein
VRHLVFVAGLVAPHGGRVIDAVAPTDAERMAARRDELLAHYRGRTLADDAPDPQARAALAARGLRPLGPGRTVQGLESLNLMFQTVSWDGVPPALARTFVRCLRDPIQSRAVQERLIANAGAAEVVDLDTGHTPARSDPEGLAGVLAAIADRS